MLAAADAVVGGIPFISLYRKHGCYIASEKLCNKWHYARSGLDILSQNISSCLIKVHIELLHVFILAIVALWRCRLWQQRRGGDIQRILLIVESPDQSNC